MDRYNAHINGDFEFTDQYSGEPPPKSHKDHRMQCECRRFETEIWCDDSSCSNRQMGSCCPVSCGTGCRNQSRHSTVERHDLVEIRKYPAFDPREYCLVAKSDICPFMPVCPFYGEILSKGQYENLKYQKSAEGSTLDYCIQFEVKSRQFDPNFYYTAFINAELKRNMGSFVNHSHMPNARFEPWYDGQNYILMLQAEVYIAAGSEITVHYGREWFEGRNFECMCVYHRPDMTSFELEKIGIEPVPISLIEPNQKMKQRWPRHDLQVYSRQLIYWHRFHIVNHWQETEKLVLPVKRKNGPKQANKVPKSMRGVFEKIMEKEFRPIRVGFNRLNVYAELPKTKNRDAFFCFNCENLFSRELMNRHLKPCSPAVKDSEGVTVRCSDFAKICCELVETGDLQCPIHRCGIQGDRCEFDDRRKCPKRGNKRVCSEEVLS